MAKDNPPPQNHLQSDATNSSERDETSCNHTAMCDGECRLSDTDFDQVEIGFLNLMRRFLLFVSEPLNPRLSDAIQSSAKDICSDRQDEIAQAIVHLMGALHHTRRSAFVFSNPECMGCRKVLTEHERRVVSALAAIRRKQDSDASVHIMLTCEGQPDRSFHRELCEMAALLPAPTKAHHNQVPPEGC